MAERRMLAKSVILYDRLVDLSHATQMLYIHLNMHADDDGFVGNPKPIMAMIRCREKHLQDLLENGFLLRFPSGVVVITHWRVNNQLRKDRYKATRYVEERSRLKVLPSGLYTVNGEGTPLEELSPAGCQTDNQRSTQIRIRNSPVKPTQAQSISGDNRQPVSVVAPPPAGSSSPTAFERMVLGLYAEYCSSLPECEYLCEDTRRRLRELESIGWTEESLAEVFRLAGENPFLTGQNKAGWHIDIHWLSKDDNLRKVLAGRYEDWVRIRENLNGCSGLGEAEMEAIRMLLGSDDAMGIG